MRMYQTVGPKRALLILGLILCLTYMFILLNRHLRVVHETSYNLDMGFVVSPNRDSVGVDVV